MSRSSWKPLFIDENIINKKKKFNTIYNRNMTIDISCIDINFKVYNGTRFFEILVNKNMLGHKFGEFAPSKIKTVHKKKK